MSITELPEVYRRFINELQELQKRYVAEFKIWLEKRRSESLVVSDTKDVLDKIAADRQQFETEFLNRLAPKIIKSLHRDQDDVLTLLRSFDTLSGHIEKPPVASWEPPGPWLTSFAAAFGAMASVVIFALQVDIPTSITHEAIAQWMVAAAFCAAFGAGVAVSIVSYPSIEKLSEHFRRWGQWLVFAIVADFVRSVIKRILNPISMFRKRSGVLGGFLGFLATALSGLFGAISWLLGGAKPLNVLIALIAIGTVVATRWAGIALKRDANDRDLADYYNRILSGDAQQWAALAAGLVIATQRSDQETGKSAEVTNIILSRRKIGEPAERILHIIEQQLGLPIGTTQPSEVKAKAEFVWRPEHAQDYTTFGIVEVGDLVQIIEEPLAVEQADGNRRVTQKRNCSAQAMMEVP